jgi:hypothetical protein
MMPLAATLRTRLFEVSAMNTFAELSSRTPVGNDNLAAVT